jgi:hypothetical protein
MKTKNKKITDLKTTLEDAFFPVKDENFGKNLIDLIDELSNDRIKKISSLFDEFEGNKRSIHIGLGFLYVENIKGGYRVGADWGGNMGNNQSNVDDRLMRIHPDLNIDNLKKIATSFTENGSFDYQWEFSAIIPNLKKARKEKIKEINSSNATPKNIVLKSTENSEIETNELIDRLIGELKELKSKINSNLLSAPSNGRSLPAHDPIDVDFEDVKK